ncbi:MAG: hypothetical protein ABJC13_02450 [Acidobacteriota bacterium]
MAIHLALLIGRRAKVTTLGLLLSVWALSVSGQVARFLAIEGAGTASLILDGLAKTAYITDGGQGGVAGIQGAEIENKDVLSYLQGQKVKRLVITCSHPHSDHLDGLKAVVQDPQILNFTEIIFVDNEYATTTRKPSLYELYLKKHGEGVGRKVSYSSANKRDAFSEISGRKGSVKASNFVYDPTTIGTNVHDQSVVTQYEISGQGKVTRIVDLDDASSALIKTLAEQTPPPRLDVLVASHHGSANNDLSPLLSRRKALGLRDVVITANAANRYDHPSPEVLLRLVSELGPDHVFVTGSRRGESVDITFSGVRASSQAKHRERLGSFIESQMLRHQALSRSILQKAQAKTADKALLQNSLGQRPSDEFLAEFASRGVLSRKEVDTLRRSMKSVEVLDSALRVVKPKRKQDLALALMLRDFDPLTIHPDKAGPKRDPSSKGTGQYRELQARADENMKGSDRGGAGPGPRSDAPGLSLPRPAGPRAPHGGSMGNDLNLPGTRGSGAGPQGSARSVTRFRSMRMMRIPIFGGVILGNDHTYRGAKPIELQFLPLAGLEEGSEPQGVVLRVLLSGGEQVDYLDLTFTELWAAYHFVKGMTVQVGGENITIPENAAGLVGMTKILSDHWTFAIHPAIAQTYLARDAMRLDMLLARLCEQGNDVPKEFLLTDKACDFVTYQWYDDKANVWSEHGRLMIQPFSQPKDCFLRVRLVFSPKPPAWWNPKLGELSYLIEAQRRLTSNSSAPADSSPQRDQLRRVIGLLEEEYEATLRSDDSLNPIAAPICRDFDALQSISRFARVVAILNWYQLESGRDLPQLPSFVIPVRQEVPSSWALSAVFAGPRADGEPGLVPAPTSMKIPHKDPEPPRQQKPRLGLGCSILLTTLGAMVLITIGAYLTWRFK